MLETTRFLDLDCVRLTNERISLLVTTAVGPRILALHLDDGDNLFAELPGVTIPGADAGPFHMRGGHRLWHAPEVPARTYVPDDRPVEITECDGGLIATPPVEPATGLQKQIRVRLPADDATVIVDHTLTNHTLWPVECAPWAITQVKPDGVAILPHPTTPSDTAGVQPNRSLILWPYTDVTSPCFRLGNSYSFVYADQCGSEFKLGFPNPRGWLAYHRRGTLFVKQAHFDRQADYVDAGSSSQCYCDSRFLELETLGPRTTIAPGDSVTHREVWRVYAGIDVELTEPQVDTLVDQLDLDRTSQYLRREAE